MLARLRPLLSRSSLLPAFSSATSSLRFSSSARGPRNEDDEAHRVKATAAAAAPKAAADLPVYQIPSDSIMFSRAVQGEFPEPANLGPFGTVESPAIVLSHFETRVVGCTGGGSVPHRMLWFSLKSGPKHICEECGQCFLLITANNFQTHKRHLTEEQFNYFAFRTAKRSRPDGAILTTIGEEVIGSVPTLPHYKVEGKRN